MGKNFWRVEKKGYLTTNKTIKHLGIKDYKDFYEILKFLGISPLKERHNTINYKFYSLEQIEQIKDFMENGISPDISTW